MYIWAYNVVYMYS